MAYKLIKSGGIYRLADGASIPPSLDNMDYQEYLAWVAKGNTPIPADVVPEDKTHSIAERLYAVEKVLTEKKVLSQEELDKAIKDKVGIKG